MAKELNIGIFGCKRGTCIVSTLGVLENVRLHAVCDRDVKAFEKRKETRGIGDDVLFFTDFDEFIECGLDAVFLANNFHEHAKYAIKCIEKGIAVLSDTTAAGTLKECVELCEAVEKYNGKYMLGANVPFMNGMIELNRIYKEGSFGKVLYAEGEYFHMETEEEWMELSSPTYHWRNYLPGPYYNMHSLGPLMYITDEMPKYVNGRSVYAPNSKPKNTPNKNLDAGSFCLYETEKDAIFSTTGCCQLGPTGKWFRLVCENGTIETKRENQDWVIKHYTSFLKPKDIEKGYESYAAPEHIIDEIQRTVTHGGSDFLMAKEFIDYIQGKTTPFFTIYPAVTLSAAGIMGWLSVLDNGNCYEIPDFTKKEERDKWRNHDLTPFPDENGEGATLPCCSRH